MTCTASKLNRALFMGMGLLLIGATSGHAGGNLSAAQEMFAEHRYAAGLVPLRKAAETGDREARRTLGLMLLYGEALYAAEVPTNREDGLRWLRLAAVDGCETSMHVLAKLGKTSRLPNAIHHLAKTYSNKENDHGDRTSSSEPE